MDIGLMSCSYFMRIYGYQKPENFGWGDMVVKYESEFSEADFLALAAEIRQIGFSSLEIWKPMYSDHVYTPEQAKSLAGRLANMGFSHLAYCIGGWSARDLDQVEPAYIFARALGCQVVTGCITLADAELLLPEIERCGKKYQMRYAIENHPLPSVESPEDIRQLTDRFSTIGANVDTGIYNRLGYDVLAAAEVLKEKIYHVHLKDTPREGSGCLPLGDGDTPLAPLLRKLREWQYPHMISVEFEYLQNPLPGLYKSLGFIQGVLAD